MINETVSDKWDFFICHVAEDKDAVAEPLAKALQYRRCSVWYDRWMIRPGDRLIESIRNGLRSSRFGLVILSPAFKRAGSNSWSNWELGGLIELWRTRGRKIIPLLHRLRHRDVSDWDPMLGNVKALSLADGLNNVADALATEAGKEIPAEPYSHLDVRHDYRILDTRGRRTFVRTSQLLEVRKTEANDGGSFWEAEPHGLTVALLPGNTSLPSRRSGTPLEITKRYGSGSLWGWRTRYDPPLHKGDRVWLVAKFTLHDTFTRRTCHDKYNSMVHADRFLWRVTLPSGRPATSWEGTVFYSYRGDILTLARGNRTGRRIEWEVREPEKGAMYQLTWTW